MIRYAINANSAYNSISHDDIEHMKQMEIMRDQENALKSTIHCLELELSDRNSSAIIEKQANYLQLKSMRVQIDSMKGGRNNSLEELELLRSDALTVEKVVFTVFTV